MSTYQDISTAPKDREILVVDAPGDDPYITKWWDDVWTNQGGRGGPAGWFSGKYCDPWGDYSIMDNPVRWTEVPKDE